MKRPLVVINGPLVEVDGRLLVNQHTGRFLRELAQRSAGLDVLQYKLSDVEREGVGGLNEFALDTAAGLRGIGLPYHPSRPLRKQWDRLRLYLTLPAALRRARWLYAFLPGTLPMAACGLARRLGLPYGVYVRGRVDLASPAVRRVLAKASLVACNNTHTATELEPHCRALRVAPPMMAVEATDLGTVERPARLVPQILYVGRLEAPKGLPELWQALAGLVRNGQEFNLTLVGNGPLADPAGLPAELVGRTTWAGFVSDKEELAAFYRNADLLVLPTHDEGFPRVLYEAMTYGAAVATTFVGGIPSLMRDDVNAARLEPRDPANLARVLGELLGDPERRRRLAGSGLATMREVFSRTGPSHAAIVHQVLEEA